MRTSARARNAVIGVASAAALTGGALAASAAPASAATAASWYGCHGYGWGARRGGGTAPGARLPGAGPLDTGRMGVTRWTGDRTHRGRPVHRGGGTPLARDRPDDPARAVRRAAVGADGLAP